MSPRARSASGPSAARHPVLRVLVAFALFAIVAGPLQAQRLALVLRPQVGDTLVMRLEQTTSVSGDGGGRTMSTTLGVRSRTIVERVAPGGVIVTSITDSVTVTGSDPHAAAAGAQARRTLVGQRVQALLSPQGTITMLDRRGVARAAADLTALVPAALPAGTVRVGEEWVRRLRVPASLGAMGADSVELRATFRLDSLVGERFAYISLHGELAPPDEPRRHAGRFTMTGTLLGHLVLDRVRGWLSDSRVALTMRAVGGAVPAAATREATAPMKLVVRVEQRLRTLDTRRPGG